MTVTAILPGECHVEIRIKGRPLTFEVVEVVGGVEAEGRSLVEVHVRHRTFRKGRLHRAVVPTADIR